MTVNVRSIFLVVAMASFDAVLPKVLPRRDDMQRSVGECKRKWEDGSCAACRGRARRRLRSPLLRSSSSSHGISSSSVLSSSAALRSSFCRHLTIPRRAPASPQPFLFSPYPPALAMLDPALWCASTALPQRCARLPPRYAPLTLRSP
jgi:hypothetical protein